MSKSGISAGRCGPERRRAARFPAWLAAAIFLVQPFARTAAHAESQADAAVEAAEARVQEAEAAIRRAEAALAEAQTVRQERETALAIARAEEREGESRLERELQAAERERKELMGVPLYKSLLFHVDSPPRAAALERKREALEKALASRRERLREYRAGYEHNLKNVPKYEETTQARKLRRSIEDEEQRVANLKDVLDNGASHLAALEAVLGRKASLGRELQRMADSVSAAESALEEAERLVTSRECALEEARRRSAAAEEEFAHAKRRAEAAREFEEKAAGLSLREVLEELEQVEQELAELEQREKARFRRMREIVKDLRGLELGEEMKGFHDSRAALEQEYVDVKAGKLGPGFEAWRGRTKQELMDRRSILKDRQREIEREARRLAGEMDAVKDRLEENEASVLPRVTGIRRMRDDLERLAEEARFGSGTLGLVNRWISELKKALEDVPVVKWWNEVAEHPVTQVVTMVVDIVRDMRSAHGGALTVASLPALPADIGLRTFVRMADVMPGLEDLEKVTREDGRVAYLPTKAAHHKLVISPDGKSVVDTLNEIADAQWRLEQVGDRIIEDMRLIEELHGQLASLLGESR